VYILFQTVHNPPRLSLQEIIEFQRFTFDLSVSYVACQACRRTRHSHRIRRHGRNQLSQPVNTGLQSRRSFPAEWTRGRPLSWPRARVKGNLAIEWSGPNNRCPSGRLLSDHIHCEELHVRDRRRLSKLDKATFTRSTNSSVDHLRQRRRVISSATHA